MVQLMLGCVYNLLLLIQGVLVLMIIGLFDCFGIMQVEGFDYIYGLVEVIKCVFILCNQYVIDLVYMSVDVVYWLLVEVLEQEVGQIDMQCVVFWLYLVKLGDIIWMGVVDV